MLNNIQVKNFKIVKHNDIDFKKWDFTILNSTYFNIFLLSSYLNTIHPKWDALVYNDYEAICPLTHKVKYTLQYYLQPLFVSQFGLTGKFNLEIEQVFFNFLKMNYSIVHIELNQNHFLPELKSYTKHTFLLDLQIANGLNTHTKRKIKLAEECGLKIIEVINENVTALTHAYLLPFLKEQLKLNNTAIQKAVDIIITAQKQKHLKVFIATDNNHIIHAIGYFITYSSQVVYFKGTTIDKSANNGAMHLLMNYAINYFKDKLNHFDFAGGNTVGLEQFYKGFGALKVSYPVYRHNRLPKIIKLMLKLLTKANF